MTEEIIDGIDVSGCYWKCKDGDCVMYYADLSSDNNEIVYGFNCEDNPNCYYKQLQRAKRELQEQKEKYEILKKTLENHEPILKCIDASVKVENMELKEANEELQAENEKLKTEIEELKRYEYTYLDKFLDLKQALEEIRQFCGTYMNNDAVRPIYENILKIIDGDSEPIPDDEIPF